MEQNKNLKWSDLPDEILNHFYIRFLLIFIGIAITIVFGILSGLFNVALMFIIGILLYLAYQIYYCILFCSCKIYCFTGTCEKKVAHALSPSVRKKPIFTLMGRSYLVVRIENTKLEVPVGNSFDAEEGNIIRFYAIENTIYPKNDNTYIVTNPFLVVVAEK